MKLFINWALLVVWLKDRLLARNGGYGCWFRGIFGKKKYMDYIVPAQTRIGHVHLKVADLERSLQFYRDLLGFSEMQRYGDSAVFISAGGYHHHIGLNTWYSKNAAPAPVKAAGLFHTAILYPTRKDLAAIFKRLVDASYPLSGASDHGVSEAAFDGDRLRQHRARLGVLRRGDEQQERRHVRHMAIDV